MRITFVLPRADNSGGAKVVATYAHRLSQKGHAVTVVSLPPPTPTIKARLKSLLLRRIWIRRRTSASYLDGIVGITHLVLDKYRPLEAADVPDADIVVATWWETAEWVAILPTSKGKKFHLVQGYEVFSPMPVERVRAVYRLPLKRIAVSQWVAKMMKLEGDNDVVTIPIAVDFTAFDGSSRSRPDEFTVGFVNNEMPEKNSALAIEAVTLAARMFPKLRVKSFGHGEAPELSEELEARFMYYQNPPQEEIPDIYAGCDVWLFTSRAEGFGLPILEAMASGTPVIATYAGAAPELVVDGDNGYVVASDVAGVVARIADTFRMSDEEWRRMSKKASSTARAYTWDDATELLEALFRLG